MISVGIKPKHGSWRLSRIAVGISGILFGFLGEVNDTFAQSFRVTLSQNHIRKVEACKSGAEKLKKYKAFYKRDSARTLKQLSKVYKKRADSTAKAYRRQKGQLFVPDTSLVYKLQARCQSLDSLIADSLKKKVTAQEVHTLLEKQLPARQGAQLHEIRDQYGGLSREYQNYLLFLQDSVSLADTVKVMLQKQAEEEAKRRADEIASEYLPGVDKNFPDLPGAQQYNLKMLTSLPQPDSLKEFAKSQLVEHALATAQTNPALMELAEKMAKLRAKYSTLLNSNDLSTGIKAKSLEGTPLSKRFVFGGNFGVPSTSPVVIDLSPQIGYRLDKRFEVGFGITSRFDFDGWKISANSIRATQYGCQVFSRYRVAGNWLLYAELERVHTQLKTLPTGTESMRQWVSSYLIGAGREFTIHSRLKGMLLLLWNANYRNEVSPYPSPLVIRTGLLWR